MQQWKPIHITNRPTVIAKIIEYVMDRINRFCCQVGGSVNRPSFKTPDVTNAQLITAHLQPCNFSYFHYQLQNKNFYCIVISTGKFHVDLTWEVGEQLNTRFAPDSAYVYLLISHQNYKDSKLKV